MKQPRFFKALASTVSTSIPEGFWLVHTSKFPNGLIRNGDQTKPVNGTAPYLKDVNGARKGLYEFGDNATFTGPFPSAHKAFLFRKATVKS